MEEIYKAIWSSPLPLQAHLLQIFFLMTYTNIVWLSYVVSVQYSALEDYSTAPSPLSFLPPSECRLLVTSDNLLIYLWFYIF